jgi:hypothetical protein
MGIGGGMEEGHLESGSFEHVFMMALKLYFTHTKAAVEKFSRQHMVL